MAKTRLQIKAIKAKERHPRGFGEFLWKDFSPKEKLEATNVFYTKHTAKSFAKKKWDELPSKAKKDLGQLFRSTVNQK